MVGFKMYCTVAVIIGLVISIILFANRSISPCKQYELNFIPLKENESHHLNLKGLPKNDYDTNLDITFNFKLNTVCDSSEKLLLLILVHSSSTNFYTRQIIRETWGTSSENVKIAFLVGISAEESVNEQLKVESFQHKDIIQGDFLDSYRNITYKHTMGMKYFIYHCSNAKYVLKVDDDILVNTNKLQNFLTEEVSPNGAKNVIMCATVVNARTLRSYRSKWRISFEEYPYRYFPTFCRGMVIVYSPDIIYNLYKEAQNNKKYVKLDDVFYTGITAERIGYTAHSNIQNSISFVYKRREDQVNVPKDLNSYLFVGSELNEKDILKLWNLLGKEAKSHSFAL